LKRFLKFRDWSIKYKIVSKTVITLALVLIGVHFFLAKAINDRLISEKKMSVKSAVEILSSIIDAYEIRIAKGEFTREVAKVRALRNIDNLKFNGENYFIIIQKNSKIILHPAPPDHDKPCIVKCKDTSGKDLFPDVIEEVEKKGENFYSYNCTDKTSSKPSPQIAYLSYYKPWDWIIGTVVSTDEVEKEITTITTNITFISILFAVLIMGLSYYIADYITKPLQDMVKALDSVAEGNLDVVLEKKSNDETGLVVARFNNMISERKKAEEKLLEKNRELSDFAYRVSHDLKNPVNIINGYIELLETEPEMLSEFVPRMREQNQKMLTFIDSLLKLSRAGKAIDKKDNLEVLPVLLSVVSNIKNLGIPIETNFEITQETVIGDLDSIYLLIQNIMENAVKYRDPQKEKVTLNVKCCRNDNISTITITDNGIGIKPDYFDKVFQPGVTIDKKKGTGFGLAIASRIVTAHGGTIKVESPGENQGSTFTINLPLS
jgi:signal transduction histidine kinase